MSAAELRRAAETLRGRAGATTPDREFWTTNGITGWACDGSWVVEFDERAAAYIATMHPGVGLALADLLARAAFLADEAEHASRVVSDQAMSHIPANYAPIVLDALTLARLINGAQPDGGV